jgi:single-stranded-DNA-specific exonuclease
VKWVKRNDIKVKSDLLLIEKLAKVRGISNLEDWINPPSKYVHSPYMLSNIDLAVQRIIKAIHTQQKIQIVADIDTDGVCSTGIMYNYLKELTPNITYIHSQRSEGHGVETVLDKIQDDTQLVIIVDSSSNSVEACKELKEKEKDVIIIDHHKVDRINPYAILVNCQLNGYPNKELSGSAMVYKVCQVLDEYLDIDMADNFLDLTAIGLVGDMMSVRDMENRYLIYNGINKINNLGIKEILKQSGVDFSEGITSTDISFKIAPIIGACSRFDRIELALELITTEDQDRIVELTKIMIDMNEQRKAEQKEIVESATKNIDTSNNVIIIVNNEIGSGFRGLIATDVVEKYSKPVFVLAHKNGNKYMGSARTVGLIPLKTLCQKSGLFDFVQGHEGAFGVAFKKENLEKIIDYFNKTLDSEDLQKVIEYDLELNADEIDEMDIKQVEKFSRICGQGFPEPKFLIKGLTVEEDYSKKLGNYVRAVMGSNNNTVKISCENNFALMKFRTNEDYGLDIEKHYYDDNNFMTELEVVGSLNLNSFYNRGLGEWVITKQIFIDDYRIVD